MPPSAAVIPPPRLPSLSPVPTDHSGDRYAPMASLLPPGCFANRPTAVFSAPAFAAPAALPLPIKVLQLSPVASPAHSSHDRDGGDDNEAVTYIGMSPTSSAAGDSQHNTNSHSNSHSSSSTNMQRKVRCGGVTGGAAAPSPPSVPVRRDQRWNGLALAAAEDGVKDRRASRAAPSPPPASLSGFTYRRGAPYNIITNLP